MKLVKRDVSEWIDAEKELPKKDDEFYLCKYKSGDTYQLSKIHFVHRKWGTLVDVTHWLRKEMQVYVLTEDELQEIKHLSYNEGYFKGNSDGRKWAETPF